jgi:hypothetical protein
VWAADMERIDSLDRSESGRRGPHPDRMDYAG